MPIDFTGQHRIRMNGQDYPLHGFTVIPAYTLPAGIHPVVQEAMRAYGPPQARTYLFETVTFTCELTLNAGETYDYVSAKNQKSRLEILEAGNMKYRGVLR